MDPILEAKNISKSFAGVYALRNVSLKIYSGKVNAIIGENGAGKSTLMKILSGVYHDYEGEIIYQAQTRQFLNPRHAEENGIAIIHQELNLIPQMTVAENIFLGREPVNRLGFIDQKKMHKATRELLDRLQLKIDPFTKVGQLRVGQQQMVEIARVLQFDCKLLIMDEPTSAISEKEVELLFDIIRQLKEKGVAIVYISHKINELFRIADRFAALRDGEFAGGMDRKDASPDDLIRMMVGRELLQGIRPNTPSQGVELLRVSNLSLLNPDIKGRFLLQDVSFNLHKGEILGISGLMGAGRTELLEAIFGLHHGYVAGDMYMEGRKVQIQCVGDAISAGFALVPEDRKLQGLILNMSTQKNTTLSSLKAITHYGILNSSKERKLANEFKNKLNIRFSSLQQPVETLSGGNQQKVVIAKWLATNPKILLLDEPTRGIDVGAKQEIYRLIEKLASEGMGIIMVSSELSEILALSHRIMVISESKMTAMINRDQATEEIIMRAALAGKKN